MVSALSQENPLLRQILISLRQREIIDAATLLPNLIDDIIKDKAVSFLAGFLAFLQKDFNKASYFLKKSEKYAPYYAFVMLQQELQTLQEEEDFLQLLKKEDAFFNQHPILYEIKANSLLQLNHIQKAKELICYAYQRFPEKKDIFFTLIRILIENGEFYQVEALLNNALKTEPNDPRLLSALASIYNSLNLTTHALDLYRRAIMLTPQDARLRLNHSIALLKAKRFAQGWIEHEWRFHLPNHTSLPIDQLLPSLTKDHHTISLKGKTILIAHEEGFGDVLMYLRYIPILAQYGASITVWGSEMLKSLTQKVEGVSSVQVGGSAPHYDYHCPFISLPRVFHAHPTASMGVRPPYLTISEEKISYWQKILPQKKDHHLRIGLTWAGGSHKECRSARLMNYQRSASLKTFAPLAELSQCEFYSLQKGDGEDELKENPAIFPKKIHNYMDQCHNMEDTAALITQLDLVITVDTSIVHLAGGLGKKTFLLNRYTGCWRWGHDERQSLWYPTVHIFKQKYFNDWSHPIKEILQTLQTH